MQPKHSGYNEILIKLRPFFLNLKSKLKNDESVKISEYSSGRTRFVKD